ncbi:hypothetical protein ACJMK2_032659 [Sinanodonta woodiana]|uniref:RRM domain-containing protein n=1 Tax=Sinanodonta woodiana TaxID=1069815 RepID=A0ABD3X4A7_SINWO
MATHKTYSVFVGHLSKDVKKADLQELFSGCGDVVDVLIVKNTKTDAFSYGFVRYSELLMAQKAVSELNRWTLRGFPLVVSLAKETVNKIAEEKLNSSCSEVRDQRQKYKRENHEITGLKSSDHVKNVMYLSRLQENCTALNLDLAKNGSTKDGQDGINVHMLIEDIKKTDCAIASPVWGDFTQRNNSLQSIKERLFERAKTKNLNDSLGQKKAQEFLSSLNAVMSTVNSFLRENMKPIDDNDNDNPKVQTAGKDQKVHKMLEDMVGSRSGKKSGFGSEMLTVDPPVVHVIQSNHTKETFPSLLVRSDSQTSSTSEDDYNDFISDSGIECDGDMFSSPVLSKVKDRSSKALSCFDADLSSCKSCESQDISSSSRDSIFSSHSSSLELVRSPNDTISKMSPSCMSDNSHPLKGKLKSMKGDITGMVQPSSHKSNCPGGFNILHHLGRGRGGKQVTCLPKPLASLGRGYAILDSAKKE